MKSAFVLVAASVLALPLLAAAQAGEGLTLSLCSSSTDCKAPRQCYDATTTTTLSPCRSSAENPSLCACQPTEVVSCGVDKKCPDGEACARTLTSPNYCADPAVVAEVPDLFAADQPAPTVAPLPEETVAPVWQAIAKKPVGDSCSTPLQCGDNLYCLAFTGAQPGTPFCAEGDTCRCVPRSTVKCMSQSECPGGSTCVGVNGGATVCLDPEVAEEVPGLLPVTSISPLPSPASTVVPRETPAAPTPAAETPTAPTPAAPTPAAPTPAAPTPVAPTPAAAVTPDVDAPVVTPPVDAPTVTPSVTPEAVTPAPSPSTSVGASMTPSATPSMTVGASPSVSPPGPVPPTPVAVPDPDATTEPEASSEAAAEPSGSPTPDASAESSSTSPTPTPTPVCIAAHHLEEHDSLVFDNHIHSNVLCDAQHSCATATHIVVYNGKPMSMRTYCKSHAACVEKAMLVNSPKYTRKLRVPSRTDGLEFTAFAARFGTKVEEHVLSAAVRLSL